MTRRTKNALTVRELREAVRTMRKERTVPIMLFIGPGMRLPPSVIRALARYSGISVVVSDRIGE